MIHLILTNPDSLSGQWNPVSEDRCLKISKCVVYYFYTFTHFLQSVTLLFASAMRFLQYKVLIFPKTIVSDPQFLLRAAAVFD